MSTLEWSAGPRLVRREENCRDYGQRAEKERERGGDNVCLNYRPPRIIFIWKEGNPSYSEVQMREETFIQLFLLKLF